MSEGIKVAQIVIGAGSGMGAAVARAIAPRGPLLVADVDRTNVEKLARDLGGDVVPATCDVTDQSQVDELVEQIDDLESLVCTAGISTSMSSSGRRIFDVNLIGMNRVLAAVEPLLRPGTVAVLFASMSGYRVPERSDLFRILDNPLPNVLRRPDVCWRRSGSAALRLPDVQARSFSARRDALPPPGEPERHASCPFRPASMTRR